MDLGAPAGGLAGWIAAAIAAITLIIYVYFRRRPSVITCQEIERLSLVTIQDQAKGKLVVSYNGEPISKASYFKIKIFNKGTETANDIDLVFKFSGVDKIHDVEIEVENGDKKDISNNMAEVEYSL